MTFLKWCLRSDAGIGDLYEILEGKLLILQLSRRIVRREVVWPGIHRKVIELIDDKLVENDLNSLYGGL